MNRNNRSGKWSAEEEQYAEALMEAFHAGLLTDIEEGISLRKVLAKKLFCSAKRISKKFEGTNYNGKMIYLKKTDATEEVLTEKKAHLDALEKSFLASITSIPYNFMGQAAQDLSRQALPSPSALRAMAMANADLAGSLPMPPSQLGVLAAARNPPLALAGGLPPASLYSPLHPAAVMPSLQSIGDPRLALSRNEAFRAVLARANLAPFGRLQQPELSGLLQGSNPLADRNHMDRYTELLASAPGHGAAASRLPSLAQTAELQPRTTNLGITTDLRLGSSLTPGRLAGYQQRTMAANALLDQQRLEQQRQSIRPLSGEPRHADGNCLVETAAQSNAASKKRSLEDEVEGRGASKRGKLKEGS